MIDIINNKVTGGRCQNAAFLSQLLYKTACCGLRTVSTAEFTINEQLLFHW